MNVENAQSVQKNGSIFSFMLMATYGSSTFHFLLFFPGMKSGLFFGC